MINVSNVFEELAMSDAAVSGSASKLEREHRRRAVPPLLVIGFEGLWGLALNAGLVLPAAYALSGSDLGHAEDVYDAWVQLRNSAALQGYVIGRILVVLGFNVCIIFINALAGAVQKALIAACRPVFVWAFELLLYYCITNRAYGHEWEDWSWLQLAGMVLLIGGCLRYSLESARGKLSWTAAQIMRSPGSGSSDSDHQGERLLESNDNDDGE